MAEIRVTAYRSFGLDRTISTDCISEYRMAGLSDADLGAIVRDAMQAAERIEAVKPGQRVTKWDIIGDRERAELDRTPFEIWDGPNKVPGRCGTCGTDTSTEGKFARHYVLNDIRYKNLGHCPTEDEPKPDAGAATETQGEQPDYCHDCGRAWGEDGAVRCPDGCGYCCECCVEMHYCMPETGE